MNVVWHDNERMQIIMAKRTRVVMDGFYHQSGHGWLPEVERPGAGLLQEAVQCGKGLAGAECPGREGSMRGASFWTVETFLPFPRRRCVRSAARKSR